MTMNEHMAGYPLWVQIWLGIMMLTILLAIPFAIKDWRARFVLLSMVLIVPLMNVLFAKYGFTRILGLAHVIVWTPLWVYLFKNRNAHPDRKWTGWYVILAIIVIGISLLFDYVDVVRYLLGEQAVINYS